MLCTLQVVKGSDINQGRECDLWHRPYLTEYPRFLCDLSHIGQAAPLQDSTNNKN
jgi:hypothetical protein